VTVRLVLRRGSGISRTAGRFAQRILLIAGLFAVGYTVCSTAARYAYQAHEKEIFERSVALRRTPTPPNTELPASSQPEPLAAGSLVGKIQIERLKISAIIKEGVDDQTLNVAVGHIPSTALPGQVGNMGVAAHRDTLFRNLKDVRRDDRIRLTTLQGEYVYRVVSLRIVQPTDVSVLDPKPGEKALTLVTCYPFYFVGHAPQRFIVRALQVFD
jgi:sortase A